MTRFSAMRTQNWRVFAVVLAFACHGLEAQPTVSNVQARQRAGTHLVDVSYDLVIVGPTSATVSLRASRDGGQTFETIPPSAIVAPSEHGDSQTPGTRKSIVWNAGGSGWPAALYAQAQVEVVASVAVAAPTITLQPGSSATDFGVPATLFVGASGSGTLGYQWYRGASGDTSNPISGAISRLYVTPPLAAIATYWVRVSNVGGSTDSVTATVTVRRTAAPANMVLIPGGTFVQGSPSSEPGRFPDEARRTVTLTRAFHLQTTEVTTEQWDEVRRWARLSGYDDLAIGARGSAPSGQTTSDTDPVTGVNWYDVVKWLNARSEAEGLQPCYTVSGAVYRTGESIPECNFSANGYRLPTEAEWEYACRAGTTTAFYSGPITHLDSSPLDPNLNRIGWYAGNSGVSPLTGLPLGRTRSVGQKEPNAWGLYDMSGNVLEWCWDWYNSSYGTTASDPRGPTSGSARTTRGGSFSFSAYGCRSAYRDDDSIPTVRYSNVGFRPARTSVP